MPGIDSAGRCSGAGTIDGHSLIYMISTQQAQLEPISTAVFERMTAATGGKAYFAKTWKDERQAFAYRSKTI